MLFLYLFGAMLLLLVILLLIYNNHFILRHYTVETSKIQKEISIALISDLHNKEYGNGNARVVKKLRAAAPDVIVIAGDLVDKRRPDIPVGVSFADACAELAPTFYVSGNHEHERNNFEEIAAQLKKAQPLRNQWVEVAGIKLLGLLDHFQADGSSQEEALSAFEREEGYKVVMIHRPASYYKEEKLRERKIDLQLSGHTHGGVVHLPFIGPFFAPGEGLFAHYVQGMFDDGGPVLIISGGLGNTRLPLRLFNFPEIPIISIKNKKTLAK